MCGFCNLFGFGRRNNDGCGCDREETCYEARRSEPRMNRYCASGIGTANDTVCGCEESAYERDRCGCDCDCCD